MRKLIQIFFVSFLLMQQTTWAASLSKSSSMYQTVRCLALEEEKIHQNKVAGASYKLNRWLMNEMLQVLDIEVYLKTQRTVCGHPTLSPSVALLQVLLLQGDKAFIVPRNGAPDPTAKSARLSSIIGQAMMEFTNYLSGLQALFSQAGCLEKAIPAITKLQERQKYLPEKNAGPQKLTAEEKKLIQQIFLKLPQIDQYIENCRKKKK